jgi:hypothetical protein
VKRAGNLRKGRHALVTASLILALGAGGAALFAPASSAATLSCPNFDDSDVPTPPAGQTGYLFIGTSISTGTSSITVHFSVNGGGDQSVTVAGTQQGGGAFQYIVNLPQGAVVSSASVTGATDNTVVTVSGCLNGPPAPPPPTVTTPGGTTVEVSPEVVTRAAVAVVVAPAFTG